MMPHIGVSSTSNYQYPSPKWAQNKHRIFLFIRVILWQWLEHGDCRIYWQKQQVNSQDDDHQRYSLGHQKVWVLFLQEKLTILCISKSHASTICSNIKSFEFPWCIHSRPLGTLVGTPPLGSSMVPKAQSHRYHDVSFTQYAKQNWARFIYAKLCSLCSYILWQLEHYSICDVLLTLAGSWAM